MRPDNGVRSRKKRNKTQNIHRTNIDLFILSLHNIFLTHTQAHNIKRVTLLVIDIGSLKLSLAPKFLKPVKCYLFQHELFLLVVDYMTKDFKLDKKLTQKQSLKF